MPMSEAALFVGAADGPGVAVLLFCVASARGVPAAWLKCQTARKPFAVS
jgi:hypothetical protein